MRPCVQVSAGGEGGGGGGATYCKVCDLLYSGGLYATPEEKNNIKLTKNSSSYRTFTKSKEEADFMENHLKY